MKLNVILLIAFKLKCDYSNVSFTNLNYGEIKSGGKTQNTSVQSQNNTNWITYVAALTDRHYNLNLHFKFKLKFKMIRRLEGVEAMRMIQ